MTKARDLANAGTALTTVSATELGYVDGVTSAIQTQLDTKVSKSGGDTITVSSGTTVPLTIQNEGTGNSFVINDETSDTTNFVVDASGSVGIGGAPVSAKLSVSGSSKVRWDVSTSTVQEAVTNAAENAYLAKSSDALSHSFKQSGTERMLIASSGNIGIGKTPSYTLDVNGTVNATTLSVGGAALTAAGLTLISATACSAVSSQAITAFSSTYDNYRIIISGSSTADNAVFIKLRSGSTDSSTGYYYFLNRWFSSNASQQVPVANGTSGFEVTQTYNGCWATVDLIQPFTTNRTGIGSTGSNFDTSAVRAVSLFNAGMHNATTSYDGINCIWSAGAFTGTIFVYGYKKS